MIIQLFVTSLGFSGSNQTDAATSSPAQELPSPTKIAQEKQETLTEPVEEPPDDNMDNTALHFKPAFVPFALSMAIIALMKIFI